MKKKPLKIAIIGAGFTGLTAANTLLDLGHDVTVYEKDSSPGGLAIGYKEENWDWPIEKHYHHWFTNDYSILNLAQKEKYPVLIKKPKTSSYIQGKIYQLDSPATLLSFPLLSPLEKIRMGIVLAGLRFNPFWKPLEKIHATTFLKTAMGEKGYSLIWDPLFKNKFGTYTPYISLAWFWARIKKRTSSLAYPTGGFLTFALTLTDIIRKKGGTVFFDTAIEKIIDMEKVTVESTSKAGNHKTVFDKVIVTLPSFLFLQIAPQLPKQYKTSLQKLESIGATNLLLRLKKPFLKDNTYWLNICDSSAPLMAIVEHTNFINKRYYNNEHLVYLGNYLPSTHPHFELGKNAMLNLYDRYLQQFNSSYKENLIGYELFKAPFAQPIIPLNYSERKPSVKTPLKNVFLVNIEQVYPWDRGTNYAVELGQNIANRIHSRYE